MGMPFWGKLIPFKSVRKNLKRKWQKKEFWRIYKNKAEACCDIGNFDDLIAKGCVFPHLTGIVISSRAQIGNNCVFYQNVTIGRKSYLADKKSHSGEYPQIGNGVIVYSGAVVVGPIKIGDYAVIGANAVVMQDVPAGAVAVGIPAKIIRQSEICG